MQHGFPLCELFQEKINASCFFQCLAGLPALPQEEETQYGDGMPLL